MKDHNRGKFLPSLVDEKKKNKWKNGRILHTQNALTKNDVEVLSALGVGTPKEGKFSPRWDSRVPRHEIKVERL